MGIMLYHYPFHGRWFSNGSDIWASNSPVSMIHYLLLEVMRPIHLLYFKPLSFCHQYVLPVKQQFPLNCSKPFILLFCNPTGQFINLLFTIQIPLVFLPLAFLHWVCIECWRSFLSFQCMSDYLLLIWECISVCFSEVDSFCMQLTTRNCRLSAITQPLHHDCVMIYCDQLLENAQSAQT